MAPTTEDGGITAGRNFDTTNPSADAALPATGRLLDTVPPTTQQGLPAQPVTVFGQSPTVEDTPIITNV